MNDASGAQCARLSPDGARLVTSSAEHIRVWSLPKRSESGALGRARGGSRCERACDRRLERRRRVRPPRRRSELRRCGGRLAPHDADRRRGRRRAARGVRALALASSLGLLASGGDDGVVRLVGSRNLIRIRCRSAAVVRCRRRRGQRQSRSAPTAASSRPRRDRRCMSGAPRTARRVHDPARGRGRRARARRRPLATGGADGAVQVWRRSGEALGGTLTVPSAVRWIGFGSDEVLIAATDHWLHSFSVGRSRPRAAARVARAGLAFGGARIRGARCRTSADRSLRRARRAAPQRDRSRGGRERRPGRGSRSS